MKRILSIIVLLLTCIALNAASLEGSWKYKKVVYTFKGDSLFIDEIGNEGNSYTYRLYHGYIYYKDYDGFVNSDVKVVKVKCNYIVLEMDGKRFHFKRLNNYNFADY